VAMTMQTVGVDEPGDGPEAQFMVLAMASLISVRSGGPPRRLGTLLPWLDDDLARRRCRGLVCSRRRAAWDGGQPAQMAQMELLTW
jgi:hypothetical protein